MMSVNAGIELTVSSEELAFLDHGRITIEGEGHAELGVVAAVHKPKLRRRNGQARACREGESDESVGCDHHLDLELLC